MPEGVVAKHVTETAAEHRPVRLPADLYWGRIVFAFITRFDQKGVQNRLSIVVSQKALMDGVTVIAGVDVEPSPARELLRRRGLGIAMCRER